MYGNQAPISDAEIRGSLQGMDTAQGNNRMRLPPNAETIVTIEGLEMKRNQKAGSTTNGAMFAAFDFKVESCSQPDKLPPGAVGGFMFPGLDSRVNNGSLAAASQSDLRRCLAAVLGWNSEAPIPEHYHTAIGGKTWIDVAVFCRNNPHNIKGRRIRIVTGSPQGAKGFVPMQFFSVA